MTTYERVTYRTHDGPRSPRRTIYVQDPQVVPFLTTQALTGVQVDRETNEVAPRGVDEQRVIIDTALITKRTPMRVSLFYGTLEEVE